MKRFRTSTSAWNHGNHFLRQKRTTTHRTFASRTISSHQCCCLLWDGEKAVLSYSKQSARNADKGICLLHNNARLHTVHGTQELLQSFRWEVLAHLIPQSRSHTKWLSDFHLFPKLEEHLSGQIFPDDDERQWQCSWECRNCLLYTSRCV